MKKIGLLSDTHGFLDSKVFQYFEKCDEIWHAGDIGTMEVAEQLENFKPFRAVYGNIDGGKLRVAYPLDNRFEVEELDVWITHIGGYPGRYSPAVKDRIKENPPGLFITGHSHILKVMRDKKLNNLLHINPGAAGNHGFHKIKTITRFDISDGEVSNLEAIELGKRGIIS